MKILLIVPCYNEEKRLDLESIEKSPSYVHFLFANDGSTDQTQQLLDDLKIKDPRFDIYNSAVNVGKAGVLQAAFQWSLENGMIENYDWIGFWDADLATPLEAVDQMLKYLELYPNIEVDSIWGSRNSRLGSNIVRQKHRHYLGRIFVTLTSMILGVKAYDSQCGAKLFRKEASLIAFKDPFISRWIFDIEILLRLKNKVVIEFPLLVWSDVPGSKVRVFKEIFRVFADIIKIRKHYL